MGKRYYEIKIASYKDISIPVWEIGNISDGFATLVCQLHGDEYSSQLIIEEILKLAKNITKTRLGLRIIGCANPLGSKLGIKNEPISDLNLNRCFKKKILNDTSQQPKNVVKALIKLINGSEFVIDIHDMPGSKLVISSILTLTGDPKIELKNRQLISRFGPKVVWLEDFSDLEIANRYSGTINNYLNSVNIPNFTIETSSIESITQKDIKIVVKNIFKLLTDKEPKITKKIKLIKRIEIRSTKDCIFIPERISLLCKIKKQKKLGYYIEKNKKIDLLSPSSGFLIRKVKRKYVKTGEKLFDLAITI